MDTSDLLRNTIYPAIFERADTAFPEMQFNRRGQDWHSPKKLDGAAPKTPRNDKTVITARVPYRLYEQGGDSLSFWDYLARREALSGNREILERLAAIAGTPLPSLDPEAMKRIERTRRAADLWAEIASYCQWCLKNTQSAEADKVREYLAGRGYKPEHIEAMGLGFMPSRAKLFEYLEGKKYPKEDISLVSKQLIQGSDGKPFGPSWGIGETHKLIIPYTASGRIIGIVARTNGDAKPKYLYPSGHGWRRPELFNLSAIRGDKDLVIMEGFLDALGASVIAGLPNIVALGDTGLNKERIEEAVRRGARKITLCLDNDDGGEKGTEKALRELRTHAPDLPVYVATFPEGKDPDDLLREQGPDALRAAIEQAIAGWEYREKAIINEYAARSGSTGEITRKDEDALLEELEREAAAIRSPIDRERFYSAAVKDLGETGLSAITEQAFRDAADRIRLQDHGEKQDREIDGLLAEAGRLRREGKQREALEVLQKRSRELQARGADYSELLKPFSWDDMKARMTTKSPALESGYKLMGKPLAFPSGALSFIVAPTSHGKTAFLLNVLLNAAQSNPEKSFHFFSYEESHDAVMQKALNIYAAGALPENEDNRAIIEAYFRGDEDRGRVTADFLKVEAAFLRELIEPGRLNIHYKSYATPEIVEAIRYLKDHGNAGGIFIDYMQLLKTPGRFGARHEELKEICGQLKDVAVETQIPLVLAAQFNRTVENPTELFNSSIGEGGDIERIASIVLGLWNGNKKPNADKKAMDLMRSSRYDFDEDGTKKGKLYLEILKNRDGRSDDLYGWLDFTGNTGKIGSGEKRKRW